MIPAAIILESTELALYMLVMFLVLFVLRIQGFGGPKIQRVSEAGHWLLIPWLSALHIITATSRLSVPDGENIVAPEIERLLETITSGILLLALATLLYRLNESATKQIISRRVFHIVYIPLIPALGIALLGQFTTLIDGTTVQGDIETKFGLVLYAAILLLETTILARIIQHLEELKPHPDQTIVYLTAQAVPPLYVRIFHSILKQFEVFPVPGIQSIVFRFIMVVLMELLVCVVFLAIGYVDRTEQQDEDEEYNTTVANGNKWE